MVVAHLEALERLPPRHAQLSVPILLSLESMYAELGAATSAAERRLAVFDSFPNQNHLRDAMLALIELLDPDVDTQDPAIRRADLDQLVEIVLFEERRRANAQAAAQPEGGRGTLVGESEESTSPRQSGL